MEQFDIESNEARRAGFDERVRPIIDFLIREALYGWYERHDTELLGRKDLAFNMGYKTFMKSVRHGEANAIIAKRTTRAILGAFWQHQLSELDVKGHRYRAACFAVYNAILTSINKTLKDNIDDTE